MKMRLLEKTIFIHQPREQVFEFFSKAENLDKVTPNWLNFKIRATPFNVKTTKLPQRYIFNIYICMNRFPIMLKTNIYCTTVPALSCLFTKQIHLFIMPISIAKVVYHLCIPGMAPRTHSNFFALYFNP